MLDYIMDLSQKVRQYYLDNFQYLPSDKQFHFVSRLAAWNNDPECHDILLGMKNILSPTDRDMADVLRELIYNPIEAHINAYESRRPYFEKYTNIRGIMMALFRVRHLLFLYNQDERDTLLTIIPLADLRKLSKELQNDADALRILSTYAINCIYLIDKILFPENAPAIQLETFRALKSAYNLTKPEDVQLFIYLYTHCIIGESNFYLSKLSPHAVRQYEEMLNELEDVMKVSLDYINLDNKLEYLVCCKIAGYDTFLKDKIMDECLQSVSPEGNFLVDTVNKFSQTKKSSFETSEHRNVLFIMSTLDYKHAP